ncbi:hypothetical protein JMG10_07775 [Nostoc ellipsosporum NOK]|nr:hypothetical protein [Nostoc ellipsosporum NOK]
MNNKQRPRKNMGEIMDELIALESLGEMVRQRAYNARVDLERFSAPAPSGGAEKKVLTEGQKNNLVLKLRKNTIKRASA